MRLTDKVFRIGLVISLALTAVGCGKKSLIDRVNFDFAENLESARVALVFKRSVNTDLVGQLSVKDYGYLFLNPNTSEKPLEVGFFLKTSIVQDQEFASFTPTRFLPNGLPIGLGRALVEIKAPTPIDEKYDLYGYVDVLHQEWVGVATLFKFMDEKSFPTNLLVSQTFLRDDAGIPRVQANAFGPSLDTDGSVLRSGGIALFANIRALIGTGKRRIELKSSEAPVLLGGPESPLEWMELESRFVKGLR